MNDQRQRGGMLLHIADRALKRPLMIHPDKVPLILGVLNGRIPLGDISEWRSAADAVIDAMPADAQAVMRGPAPDASRFFGDQFETDATGRAVSKLPYRRTKDGIGIITVTGSLINRGAWVGSYSGETSYEGIKHQIAVAAADPKVQAILLDIESPGGEAVGAFETADAIRAAAKAKPVWTSVNGMAASAAYAIASASSRIITGPTAISGSIGVVMLHADFSRQLDKAGVTPTLIYAGAHKVDGNPLEPLPDNVRSDLQTEVNRFYDLFVQTVASGRKAMSPKSIRDTEARTFIGSDAVDVGLVDAVGTFEDALAELTAYTARSRAPSQGAARMNTTTQPGADNPGTVPQDQHTAAVAAARTEGHAAGKTEGIEAGTKAAHERIGKILGSEKVKGKEAVALDLAMKSPAMSADDVIAFVGNLPAASSAKTIEERLGGNAAALTLGGPATSEQQAAAASNHGWDDVAKDINAKLGVTRK